MNNYNSDNNAPMHERVLSALADANSAHSAYGNDALSQQVGDKLRAVFEAPNAAVYLLGTGSAANALALSCMTQPYQGVFCHPLAHINQDECGAPEFFTGGSKLILVDGQDGRIDPKNLTEQLQKMTHKDVHHVQPGTLSLTNITELGTVYSLDQITNLCGIAAQAGVRTHLDGARFANALAALNCSPADMTWRAGVDMVSFGGTKNGLMGVEAVIIFDPALGWEFELRRKRAGQLFSKNWFLAAQMQAYLQDDLWLDLARHANAMASILANGLHNKTDLQVMHPVEGNMIFATCNATAHQRLQQAGIQYYDSQLNEDCYSLRLVCSWSTTAEEITYFLSQLN